MFRPKGILASLMGVANGVATLDGSGKVPSAQLPASSGDVRSHPGYISGLWYPPLRSTLGTGSAIALVSGATHARFFPFILDRDVTITDLMVRSSAQGSSNIQLAIYNNQQKAGAGSRPSTLVGATDNINNNVSPGNLQGPFSDLLSRSLLAGTLYWAGIQQNDVTGAYIIWASNNSLMGWSSGSATINQIMGSSSQAITHVSTPVTFGVWDDLTSATWTETTSSQFAAIAFKVE